MNTQGIHHITALSSSAQKTFDFYTQVIGLRLVKKTVNFDAPEVYHLYFGNEQGEPGTVLTFFPFEDAGTGMRGVGQVTKIYFAVPMESLGFWLERFVTKSIKHTEIKTRFSERYITFFDPDGLQLEIVGTKDELPFQPWAGSSIPAEHAIRGFYGAELAVDSKESIADLLTTVLGYKLKEESGFYVRYENTHTDRAKYLDLFVMAGWPEGISSAGTNHHIAFRVKDKVEQATIRDEIIKAGFKPTEIVERFYFTSVYFRERNNILFEIATDEPGFAIDEAVDQLGTALKLPSQFERQRSFIESVLPELNTDDNSYTDVEAAASNDLDLFQHKFVDNKAAQTYVLFHGTGGDETDMIKFANTLGIKANLLSIRGNMHEQGMNRFFVRNQDGSFDEQSIKDEAAKLEKFLISATVKYALEEQPLSLLGYSNGANFALAYAFLFPLKLEKLIALHPRVPLDVVKTDLTGINFVVTYGTDDEYTNTAEIAKLESLIKKAGGKVNPKEFIGGHGVGDAELEFIRKQI